MTKKIPRRVTFAIADDAPIGVVCVVMKPGLSRLFLWNTEADTFSPGQFVKADAVIQSISSDGKYFGYSAHSHYRAPCRYVCVARPPYFTALAFFPTSTYSRAGVNFENENRIIVNSENDSEISDEIIPGCPFEIDRETQIRLAISAQASDSRKDRFLFCHENIIFQRMGNSPDEQEVHRFEYEDFLGIPPPDWASEW